MPWTDIKPETPAWAASKAGATISCTKPGSLAQRLRIIVREAPSWWRRGQPVRVQLGTGADAGKLRIAPIGPFKIGSAGVGRGAKTVIPILQFPIFAGLKPGRRPMQPVAHDYTDDWIEIDLPEWAIPPANMPRVEPMAALKPMASGKPFRTEATANASRRVAAAE